MPEQVVIELPLPPEPLYLNGRIKNRYGLSRLIADARATAALIAKQVRPRELFKSATIDAVFWMPRRRDDDNLKAWCKQYQDGMQGIVYGNDSNVVITSATQVTGKAAGGQRKLVLTVTRVE